MKFTCHRSGCDEELDGKEDYWEHLEEHRSDTGRDSVESRLQSIVKNQIGDE